MEIGTAVISTWERHPHMLAAQALTTQALVGDRLIVGIGLNHQPHVEQSLRLPWHKPVRHMLDYLAILDDLLATGKASFQGEVWSFDGEGAKPSAGVPKVMIAALGDQMLKVAGRRTDGTILWCVGPEDDPRPTSRRSSTTPRPPPTVRRRPSSARSRCGSPTTRRRPATSSARSSPTTPPCPATGR